jgi:hypothetical protein
MSSLSSPLRVEALEPRDVPATFGNPWPDGQNLTLSFAPDGTPIAGTPSDLAAALAGLGPDARLEVLRAFQAWAVHANVNIGLVGDTGARFGTGGATQGDPRFGDVRVGGRPLPGDVLAVTAPYDLYDNYSGDVVLNTAAGFGPGGYDLYTALLQESGHALGVGNSADPASAMYEWYSGPRARLSAADVASIQSLYGARTPDKYEGAGGNGTLATATRFPLQAQPLAADLTTAGDADVYKFTSGLLTNQVTIRLKAAGLSLLTARVELLDSTGRVLATAAATDPTNNDVTLSFGGTRAGQTYYVRVSGARADEFAIGAYELDLKQSSLLTAVTGLVGGLLDDTGLNDTLLTATGLLGGAAVGPQTEYGVSGSFGSPRDVDVYRVVVPGGPSADPVNMLATIYGQNGRALDPWVEVTDARGRALGAEVITADGGTTTLQVRGLAPGVYFVRTRSDTGAVGGYRLAADLRAEVETVPELAAGDVSGAAAAGAPFALAQSAQVHIVVTATGAGGAAEAVLTDASGAEVGRFQANAGRGRSLDLFLPAGAYAVSVRSVGGAAVGFRLGLAVVTDPIGAKPEDPTNTPQPSTPPAPTPDQPVNNPAPAPTQSSDGLLPPDDQPQPSDPPPPQPPSKEPPAEDDQLTTADPQPQPQPEGDAVVSDPVETGTDTRTQPEDPYAWY